MGVQLPALLLSAGAVNLPGFSVTLPHVVAEFRSKISIVVCPYRSECSFVDVHLCRPPVASSASNIGTLLIISYTIFGGFLLMTMSWVVL